MDTSTLVHPSLFQSNTVTLILLSFSFSYHTPHQPVNISQKYLSIKRRQKKKRTMKIQESVFHFVYIFSPFHLIQLEHLLKASHRNL